MINFYITFDPTQYSKNGLLLYPYYIKIKANDRDEALIKFKEWSEKHLDEPNRYGMLYDEEHFTNKLNFISGELTTIE